MSDTATVASEETPEVAETAQVKMYVENVGDDGGASMLLGRHFGLEGVDYEIVEARMAVSPLSHQDGKGEISYTNIFEVRGITGDGTAENDHRIAYLCRVCGSAFDRRGQVTNHLTSCKAEHNLGPGRRENSSEDGERSTRLRLTTLTREMTLGQIVDLARRSAALEAACDSLKDALATERARRKQAEGILGSLQSALGKLNNNGE